MKNPYISDHIANIEANSINTASTFGGATLTIYDGTQPATANTAIGSQNPLVIFALPASGSNSVSSSGVITFGAITNATAIYSSTATWFRVKNGSNTIVDGSVGTSIADLVISSTSISSGATVSISNFVYTIVE